MKLNINGESFDIGEKKQANKVIRQWIESEIVRNSSDQPDRRNLLDITIRNEDVPGNEYRMILVNKSRIQVEIPDYLKQHKLEIKDFHHHHLPSWKMITVDNVKHLILDNICGGRLLNINHQEWRVYHVIKASTVSLPETPTSPLSPEK